MASLDRILLVEGESDRAFFELICRNIGLQNSVTVAPPKDLTGTHNTKEGVFNYLPTLLTQLGDGNVIRLGVVVDADNPPNGDFVRTRDRITAIVSPFGYNLVGAANGGMTYVSNDGLADFGLWVMPDNASSGLLEDWIKQCVHGDDQALFHHAVGVVGALPTPPKFSPIHLSKAEVATWMAWQKRPGHGLYRAVEDGLIDTRSPGYLALVAWLTHIFA
jgi:hypothetical protein